ncbi:unnamed protein product [Prorocentrum cordatum]|uniref:Uncharacterized protein n=1 Tax=Prorocentrum cordatum TaxID=2364126 RepID=A0ABN9XGF1_9DINO|nr:unnamed protein product [Polarella glacialis]
MMRSTTTPEPPPLLSGSGILANLPRIAAQGDEYEAAMEAEFGGRTGSLAPAPPNPLDGSGSKPPAAARHGAAPKASADGSALPADGGAASIAAPRPKSPPALCPALKAPPICQHRAWTKAPQPEARFAPVLCSGLVDAHGPGPRRFRLPIAGWCRPTCQRRGPELPMALMTEGAGREWHQRALE